MLKCLTCINCINIRYKKCIIRESNIILVDRSYIIYYHKDDLKIKLFKTMVFNLEGRAPLGRRDKISGEA